MWWVRTEDMFKVFTKYDKAFTARSVFTKSGGNGKLLDEDPFDTRHALGTIVMYVINGNDPVPLNRSYETKSHGPYKVLVSLDGQSYDEHPESYDTLTRVSTIVKKYLRKHYKKVLVVRS